MSKVYLLHKGKMIGIEKPPIEEHYTSLPKYYPMVITQTEEERENWSVVNRYDAESIEIVKTFVSVARDLAKRINMYSYSFGSVVRCLDTITPEIMDAYYCFDGELREAVQNICYDEFYRTKTDLNIDF